MIKIRPSTSADRDAIVDFQLKMALETENLKLDSETVRKGVQAVIDDPHKGAYWVAEDSKEVLAALLTVPEWSDWRNGTVLWIHSLYVVPHARNKGVFKSMYAYLQNFVKNDGGLRGIRLYVEQSNHRAQAVYEAIGMRRDHYFLYEWLK